MWNIDLERLGALFCYDASQPLLFNTGFFLFLFLGGLGIYTLLSGRRATTVRLLYLTAFSYYFYYKNAGGYCALLAVVTLVNYLAALGIGRFKSKAAKWCMVFLAVAFMLSQLAYFKYTNFALSTILPFLGESFEPLDIFLPAGISFFTFQSMSYIIDVYREKMKPSHNLLDFAFFVSFFPTLLAGPILRARDFLPQVRKPLVVTREMFGTGLWFILMGLFKKAVISDYIGENFVNRIFDAPELYTGLENLLGVYGYAIKLYCDFSGYSDMAIGIALWLGFTIPANFRSPYKSESITDFWRRWHISLSSWLRDYLYISLGGNRKGKFRMYLNLFLTMLLGGLWHGASLNFVIWGALHGIALGIHKYFRQLLGHDKHYQSHGWKRFGATFLTFHLVCFCWLFFANPTFDSSLLMMQKIAFDFHAELLPQFVTGYPVVTTLIVLGFVFHYLPESWNQGTGKLISRTPFVGQLLLFVFMLLIVIQVKSSEVQPFIYLQF